MNPAKSKQTLQLGDVLDVEAGRIVHGGHCLAHARGATIFVRNALPGEKVRISIIEKRKKVYFAQTVEVLESSVHRVEPPCSSSVDCGGCDFQHVDSVYQRRLKTVVLQESLIKFSGLPESRIESLVGDGVLELGPPGGDGLNWRMRSRFVWSNGWHMHRYRSFHLTPTPRCEVITAEMRRAMDEVQPTETGEYIIAQGDSVSISGPSGILHGSSKVRHDVFDVQWRISPASFWQAHGGLISAIGNYLDTHLDIEQGEGWWDLFGGAGVFAAYLGQRVSSEGKIVCVDGSESAVQAGKRALHSDSNIRFINTDVSEFVSLALASEDRDTPRGVLLDPPRSGAGSELCQMLADVSPQIIVYIACDPVALARDIKYLSDKYEVRDLVSWDAFPMSHHFESLAILERNLS